MCAINNKCFLILLPADLNEACGGRNSVQYMLCFSRTLEEFTDEYTWESFICICAKTWRNPTTASHRRLWARLCWFPVHGPCVNTLTVWAASLKQTSRFAERQVSFQINNIIWQRARSDDYTWNTLDTITCNGKKGWPVCTQWACWKPVWPLWWPWRSCVDRVHRSHPCLSSTSRSHWLTPME